MSDRDIEELLDRTTASQRNAARPDASAWVAANAGSGKTKVLTDRVMRLLLAGHKPSRLLCITFTKAAAAEMADRLFKRLGQWALMADDDLQTELHKLDGGAPRSTEELSAARRLFAQALETPGGLKIQTIHSFCESVLKRFPLEAGITPGFTVIEEGEATALINRIIDRLAEQVWEEGGAPLEDFRLLTDRFQEEDMRRHIFFLVSKGLDINEAIREAGGQEHFFARLAEYLNIPPGQTREETIARLRQEWAEHEDYIKASIDELANGARDDKASAKGLSAMLAAQDSDEFYMAACSFALTQKQELRKNFTNKAVQKTLPAIDDRLRQIAERICATAEIIKGVDIFAVTSALYRLALHVHDTYAHEKAHRGLMDFDDLISRTAGLFHTHAATWVLYKLDQGIEHLLVDEAQDTSGSQWQVIEGPLAEFFAGAGATETDRSLFVVGDEKQSIYSFQGADVDLFRTKQKQIYDVVAAAERQINVEDLTLSFRSTEPVLQFVDELFKEDAAAKGVSDQAELRHQAHRRGHAGHVELWPLVEKQDAETGRPWDLPVDTPGQDDPSRILARHIAGTINGWLESGEALASKGRAIQPKDILILCQRRGPVFHEIVRELVKAGVPTAGSDRVRLMDHVAARDLLAATRFALQPQDDLSLAELLKSPLFVFDDDDLFTITRNRRGRSLWRCLLRHRNEPRYDAAASALEEATAIGLAQGPYAFYTHLLETGNPSGWRRFYSRLGTGARDVLQEMLSEALNFENGNPRTLQGFLAHLEGLDTDLKKEMGGTDNLVRIMTVHGAKGLEAPIVFLADAGYAKEKGASGPVPAGPVSGAADTRGYIPQPGYYIQTPAQTENNAASTAARDHAKALQLEEYRRLLYVAATRAEDRLYICGTLPGRRDKKKFLCKPGDECSWYALGHRAFERLADQGLIKDGGELPWGGAALTLSSPQTVEPKPDEEHSLAPPVTPPSWLHSPAMEEQPVRMLSPSTLGGPLEADPDTPAAEPAAYTPLSAESSAGLTPFTRGNALHLLLERLPDVPQGQRNAAATRLLIRHYPDLSAHFEEWTNETLRVLDDPTYKPVFAAGSRAEVPVMGAIDKTIVSGQIDRLAVEDKKVLIVDYKTNRPPPRTVEEVPDAYTAQLAAYRRLLQEIYKDHEIVCALLWTWEARLMEIPPEMLDHALVQRLKAPPEAESS